MYKSAGSRLIVAIIGLSMLALLCGGCGSWTWTSSDGGTIMGSITEAQITAKQRSMFEPRAGTGGCTVWLKEETILLETAETNSEGIFLFSGIRTGGPYAIYAFKETGSDLLALWKTNILVSSDQVTQVGELPLKQTSKVSGTVISSDGTVKGAEITMVGKKVMADDDGIYSIDGIPYGNVEISVSAKKYDTSSSVIDITAKNTVRDILLVSSESSSDTGNTAPAIALNSPGTGANEAETQFLIEWISLDPDDDATISLYYDSDKTGQDGTVIVTGLSEDTDSSYQWNVSGVPGGSHYVYGRIDDGKNDPVYVYSPGTVVTPNHAPTITITATLGGENLTGDVEITWEAVDIDGDTVSITLYYSPDSGTTWTSISSQEKNDGTFSWDTTDVVNGTTYRIKVEAGDGSFTVSGSTPIDFSIANIEEEG